MRQFEDYPLKKSLFQSAGLSSLLFLILLLMGLPAAAQRGCGTMEHHQHLLESNPVYEANRQRIEAFTQKWLANLDDQTRKESNVTIVIPVVVHVVWNTADQNIPDERIEEQIQILNDDFNKLNADFVNAPGVFANRAAAFNFRFELAPWENILGVWQKPITRTQTNKVFFSSRLDDVKFSNQGGHDAVYPGEYLNLWVCPLEEDLLGYAQFPGGPPETDGVVMGSEFFGLTSHPSYGKGRTTTHEVGHWFNLYHIWGDAVCGDDLIADTPTQRSSNGGVPVYPHRPNSCDPNNPDGDMFMNFMDYSDDAALVMFTSDQKDRARALFTAIGARESFIHAEFLTTYSPGLGQGCECTPPQRPRILERNPTSIKISWLKSIFSRAKFEVRYRKSVGGTWTTLPLSPSDRVTITNLDQSHLYTVQIRALCKSGIFSEWRSLVTGTAPKLACPPLSLSVDAVGADFIEFSWPYSTLYQRVDFQLGERITITPPNGKPPYDDLLDVTRFELTTGQVRVNNLEPNKEYRAIAWGYCLGDQTGWQIDVKTQSCDDPFDLDHIGLSATSVKLNWNCPITPDSYQLIYRRNVPGATSQTISGITTTDYTITNLMPGTDYIWAIKAICGTASSNSVAARFNTANCSPPSNLTITNITNTSARLNWDAPGQENVTSYMVRHRKAGTTNWNSLIVLQPFRTLEGLEPGNDYEVSVESICQQGGGTSQDLKSNFSTTGCENPVNTIASITNTSAVLRYGSIIAGAEYEIWQREAGSSTWDEQDIDDDPGDFNGWLFVGLESETDYEARFRVLCGNGEVSPWENYSFTTLSCPVPTSINHGYPAGIGDRSVLLRWANSGGNPDSYSIELVETGTGTIISTRGNVPGSNSNFLFNGLTPSTTYTVNIISTCGTSTATAPPYNFTTRSTANARSEVRTSGMEVSFSPNPVETEVQVSIQDRDREALTTQTHIRILDHLGRVLHEASFAEVLPSYRLDLGHVVPGIYLMETSRDERVVYKKIVVER